MIRHQLHRVLFQINITLEYNITLIRLSPLEAQSVSEHRVLMVLLNARLRSPLCGSLFCLTSPHFVYTTDLRSLKIGGTIRATILSLKIFV